MSQENVEIVRRALFALERSDLDAAAEFWHPEISWRAMEGAPDDVGEMHGIEAVRRYVEDWFDTFDDFRSEPEELIDVGDDQVVAVVHITGRAKSSGVPTDMRYANVSTIRDGKVVCGREYATKTEALTAVGLEEQAVSQENVEIAQRTYERVNNAYQTGDYQGTIEDYCHPDVVLRTSGMFPETGEYRGYDGLREFMMNQAEAFEEMWVQPAEFINAGDQVVVPLRFGGTARHTGIDATFSVVHVLTIRDHKIARLDMYQIRDEALKAVGLED